MIHEHIGLNKNVLNILYVGMNWKACAAEGFNTVEQGTYKSASASCCTFKTNSSTGDNACMLSPLSLNLTQQMHCEGDQNQLSILN